MSLTVNSRIVAKVSIARLFMRQALGGFELVFGIDGETTVHDDTPFWLTASAARVEVVVERGANSHLGIARPDVPVRMVTHKSPLTVMSEFKLVISPQQLAAIEDVRAGGDLGFHLAIAGEGGGGGGGNSDAIHPSNDSLWKTIGRSDWIASLRAANAMDILLLELPMPFLEPSAELRAVVDNLRQAQRMFFEGHFTDSVINCRKAVETLGTLQGRDRNWSSDALKRLANTRETMTKDERQIAMEASLFHFASLAAHDGTTHFDRREAKFAFALATTLIAQELR